MADSTNPAKAEVILRGQKVELIFDRHDEILKGNEIGPQDAIGSFVRSLLEYKKAGEAKKLSQAEEHVFLKGLFQSNSFFPKSLHVDKRLAGHLDSIKTFYFNKEFHWPLASGLS